MYHIVLIAQCKDLKKVKVMKILCSIKLVFMILNIKKCTLYWLHKVKIVKKLKLRRNKMITHINLNSMCPYSHVLLCIIISRQSSHYFPMEMVWSKFLVWCWSKPMR